MRFVWECCVIVDVIHDLGVFFMSYCVLTVDLAVLYKKQHILAIHPAASMLTLAVPFSLHGLGYQFSPPQLLVYLQR